MDASFDRPKIDPTRRPVHDMTGAIHVDEPGNPAWREWADAGLEAPDMEFVRRYRLGRIRDQLKARDAAGCLLYDPLNIRYATDTSNMQVWCMHNAVRYCFIATEGPVVLFDFHGCKHLSTGVSTVDETRHATSWFYFGAGPDAGAHVKDWAAELAGLVTSHGGGNRRLLIDGCDQLGIEALQALGIDCISGQDFTEHARAIKHPEEIKAMRRAIRTSEIGMREMWRNLRPGITENQLWSILHQTNIARGGEWIETRLLASGPRTNPWFQECSDRVIEADDIVAFDTDLIGPYGYCSDVSRAWLTPGGRGPSNEQLFLFAMAEEMIAYNIDIFRPGMSFAAFRDAAYKLPGDYYPNRYSAIVHGVGLCDEYPAVGYPGDDKGGYDGFFEPGMCLCFEAYIGRQGGREGIKLERQALVTETGIELLDTFPVTLTPEL